LLREHSRDVLLHDQWISKHYWSRHNLPVPIEVPRHLRGHLRRVQRLGAPPDLEPWLTLRDALATVPDPYLPGRELGTWPNHLAIPGARVYAKHTGSPLDLPSKTIKAGVHGVSGGEAMLRELDGSVRYLTVRESALVQGFRQDYEFPGPRNRVMGVIGNAVAVDVAGAVGCALRAHCGLCAARAGPVNGAARCPQAPTKRASAHLARWSEDGLDKAQQRVETGRVLVLLEPPGSVVTLAARAVEPHAPPVLLLSVPGQGVAVNAGPKLTPCC